MKDEVRREDESQQEPPGAVEDTELSVLRDRAEVGERRQGAEELRCRHGWQSFLTTLIAKIDAEWVSEELLGSF